MENAQLHCSFKGVNQLTIGAYAYITVNLSIVKIVCGILCFQKVMWCSWVCYTFDKIVVRSQLHLCKTHRNQKNIGLPCSHGQTCDEDTLSLESSRHMMVLPEILFRKTLLFCWWECRMHPGFVRLPSVHRTVVRSAGGYYAFAKEASASKCY